MKDWIKNNKLTLCLLVVLIGFVSYYIYEAVTWIPYPHQIDYGEGFMMYINKMWAEGTWKWDMGVPPYIPLIYGIGMPIVNMPLIKAFGAELWTGRLIMCMSTVVISVMFYLIIMRLNGNRLWALIGAILPFTQPTIRDWSLMARVDMLSVMFDVIGLYLFVRFKNCNHRYWSIIPFILVTLTKLVNIAGLLAVIVHLLITNRRQLLKYLVVFVPSLIATFVIMQVVSGGEYLNHVVFYNGTTEFVWGMDIILNNWRTVLLPLSAFAMLAVVYVRDRWFKNIGIIGWFFLLAFFMDFFGGIRPASYINYFVEFIYATCLCAAFVLPVLFMRVKVKRAIKQHYAVMVAAIFIVMLVVGVKTAFPYPTEQYTRDVEIITEKIQDTDEPIITENSGLVLNAGKELYAEYFLVTNMAALGRWDDTNYVNDYQEQKFDYIILRTAHYNRPDADGHFSRPIMDAIKKNYTLIYDPKPIFYWYSVCLYEANDRLNYMGRVYD